MAAFREAYRSINILLLDDVHILAGKERTQEEFFHTFNALHEAGHQIVLTSDTSPATIQGLEERLRTRFVWGLVADIQPPDLETKCAIIREKAHNEGVDLPDDVVLFVARRVRENVRELEGYLNRVIVYCTLTGQSPNLETARNALTPLLAEERHATPADIIRFVAHHYGVKVADLKGRDTAARWRFRGRSRSNLIREILGLSYPEIGKLFAKHHSTVMYSVDTITEERRSNRRWTPRSQPLRNTSASLRIDGPRRAHHPRFPHSVHTGVPQRCEPKPWRHSPLATAAVLHTLDDYGETLYNPVVS